MFLAESTQDTSSNKACVMHYLKRRFILMTSCRTETETVIVECRKLDRSIVVVAISQCRRRLSACVMSHSGHFEHTNFMVFSWFSMLS